MKKSLITIIILLFLILGSAYAGIGYYFSLQKNSIVEIVAIDPATSVEVMRGVGYRVDKNTLITSAHVVPDDRYQYRISRHGKLEESLMVSTRLSERDIAVLSFVSGGQPKLLDDIIASPDVSVGDRVTIPLVRSGSPQWIHARIESLDNQILAYDNRGQIRVFSGVILPDMPFLPGDSGAPIFTKWGKLIDVVHVE